MPSTSQKADSDVLTLTEYVNDVHGFVRFVMPPTRQPLSLNSSSTGVQLGRSIQFRKGAVTRFTAQITVNASTKASFRMQGSIDGTNWDDLGSAASTFTSTASGTMTSTSAKAYNFARVKQVSMVTKAAMRARASIAGY